MARRACIFSQQAIWPHRWWTFQWAIRHSQCSIKLGGGGQMGTFFLGWTAFVVNKLWVCVWGRLNYSISPYNMIFQVNPLQFLVTFQDGYSALHLATLANADEAIQILLNKGDSINRKDMVRGGGGVKILLNRTFDNSSINIVIFTVFFEPSLLLNRGNSIKCMDKIVVWLPVYTRKIHQNYTHPIHIILYVYNRLVSFSYTPGRLYGSAFGSQEQTNQVAPSPFNGRPWYQPWRPGGGQ